MPDEPINIEATLINLCGAVDKIEGGVVDLSAGQSSIAQAIIGVGQKVDQAANETGTVLGALALALDNEHFESRLGTTGVDDILRVVKDAGGKKKVKALYKASKKKGRGSKKKRTAYRIAYLGTAVAAGFGAKMAYDSLYGADAQVDDGAFTGTEAGMGEAGTHGWGQGDTPRA